MKGDGRGCPGLVLLQRKDTDGLTAQSVLFQGSRAYASLVGWLATYVIVHEVCVMEMLMY